MPYFSNEGGFMELNYKNIKKILLIIAFGAVIFTAVQNLSSVWAFISKIFSYFSPVISALCIAFVLNVLLTALETKLFAFMKKSPKKILHRLQRPLCLVLTYLIAFGIVALLMLVIIPDIIDTVTYLADKLPGFVIEAREWLEDLLNKFNIKQTNIPDIKINWAAMANSFKEWLQGSSSKLFGDAVNITTSVFSGVFDTIFSFVISVYVLAQKEKIGRFVRRMMDTFLPKKATEKVYYLSSKTADSFSRFIGGQLTEALILGTLCFIGMSIFGFPNALIISALIAVTAVVPIVGATIGVVIGFLLIVISSPIKALLFIVFFLVLQQIEGNFIYPKVVGKAVGLPGIIVVGAVLVGGNIGGVLGALIAVPTSAVIFTLIKEAIYKPKKIEVPLE